MSLFSKIKFMPLSNLPDSTLGDEMYAIPFSIANRNAPNYSSWVILDVNTTYTVGSGALKNYSKGYLLAGCTSRSDDNAPTLSFNGYSAVLAGYDHDYGGDLSGYCIFLPAKTGDYFSVSNTYDRGSPIVRFVPTKE